MILLSQHRAATTSGALHLLCTIPHSISLWHILEHNLGEINISQITSDLTFGILFVGVFWFIYQLLCQQHGVTEIKSSHLTLPIQRLFSLMRAHLSIVGFKFFGKWSPIQKNSFLHQYLIGYCLCFFSSSLHASGYTLKSLTI